ncbi:hypothetical protein BC351_00280 [Paenibacillus ferrarius]|uniref:Uncharacterized protein n=1 Tax=Paenibacillus ferrarius TaxID=1469647 RepID=A0A1V4HRZ7_9BACL|nr:hypothetical protein [Paenibacillus ferrarius]OPH61714.1 hypothetical protein BC351_00280 [Paenibacillus ferrarius]
MTKKVKQLNLAAINNLHKEYEKQTEYQFGEYAIKIDDKFQTSKMDKLLQEYGEHYRTIHSSTDSPQEMDNAKSSSLMFMLVIKHFTDLPLPEKLTLEELLNAFSKIVNIGLFEMIINNISEENMNWVREKLELGAQSLRTKLIEMDTILQTIESNTKNDNIQV